MLPVVDLHCRCLWERVRREEQHIICGFTSRYPVYYSGITPDGWPSCETLMSGGGTALSVVKPHGSQITTAVLHLMSGQAMRPLLVLRMYIVWLLFPVDATQASWMVAYWEATWVVAFSSHSPYPSVLKTLCLVVVIIPSLSFVNVELVNIKWSASFKGLMNWGRIPIVRVCCVCVCVG